MQVPEPPSPSREPHDRHQVPLVRRTGNVVAVAAVSSGVPSTSHTTAVSTARRPHEGQIFTEQVYVATGEEGQETWGRCLDRNPAFSRPYSGNTPLHAVGSVQRPVHVPLSHWYQALSDLLWTHALSGSSAPSVDE